MSLPSPFFVPEDNNLCHDPHLKFAFMDLAHHYHHWLWPLLEHRPATRALQDPDPRPVSRVIPGVTHPLCFSLQMYQISSQKKEGKRSNPHHTCPTEKSTLLSILKIKPSSTQRQEDTNQTKTHSISCHDTNRPPSFASE